MWTPDPAFEAGSVFVADLPLCQVRLQDDARWPWLILLPRIPGLTELTDLDRRDRERLMDEVVRASEALHELADELGRPIDKLNSAALGNVTAQLHVHVIGRRRDDEAWPRPVWNEGVARPWGGDLDHILMTLRVALG
jgi:diadenosine tetraphosphate (Ap4A) HIT family hydrolase